MLKFTTGEVRDLALLPADIAACIQVCRSGCWEWQGHRNYGYGRPWWGGRAIYAHRLVFELLVEQIPAGLFLDHLCRNRPCVNPAHLEPVTQEENIRRGRAAVALGLPAVVPETSGIREVLDRPSSNEQWLPVVGWEKFYEVSDLGRARSLHAHGRGLRGRILKPHEDKHGRLSVRMCGNGRAVNRRVHSLVAEAFIGPRPPGMEIRHLNDVPGDNRLVNLAYGTSHENKLDMLRNQRNYFANRTHCPQGHAYDETNTYYAKDGGRECRACHNEKSSQRRRDLAVNGVPCTTEGCSGPQVALGVCRLCYDRQRSEARRGPDWGKRTCPHCEQPFERELAPGQGKRKYCSDDCAQEAKRIAGREYQRAKRAS